MAFYLTAADGTLYRILANDTRWESYWFAVATPPAGEKWFGTGAGAATEQHPTCYGVTPTVFGVYGIYAFVLGGWGLGEARGTAFRDHIRYQQPPSTEVMGTGYDQPGGGTIGIHPATESTVSVSPITGLATAIRRNTMPPWQVVVSDSTDAAFSWSTDYVVDPLPSDDPNNVIDSISDPYTAYSAAPPGTSYQISLQAPVGPDPNDPNYQCIPEPFQRQIVLRMGGGAQEIAGLGEGGPGLVKVAEDYGLDHDGLVVTTSGGVDTAHMTWWNTTAPATVFYRTWSAGVLQPPEAVNDIVDPPGVYAAAPVILEGAGNAVYVWTVGGTWPELCEVSPDPGVCVQVTDGSGPMLSSPDITFGASGAYDESIHRTCNSSGAYRRCFDTQQPMDVAANPNVVELYAVWQGIDPDSSAHAASIYFSHTLQGTLDNWTLPVRLNTRTSDTMEYFQPSITVDQTGFLVVDYASIEPGEVSPTATASDYEAYSVDGGASWAEVDLEAHWDPADLPFHCGPGRHKFFLGEYREGSAVGYRAYNTFPESRSAHVTQSGLWSSRWSVN